MDELRLLLDRFWVTRAQNREQYYALRRALGHGPGKRLFNELLGWRIMVNEAFIKLEKLPAYADAAMGIESFSEVGDYCLLCALLMYLEDMEPGRQFLLSELTQALAVFVEPYDPVDWARFQHRKSLVRVLRYCEEIGLLTVYEGDSGRFADSQRQEVLYETTGLSRFFGTHFDTDIQSLESLEAFEQAALAGLDADRGRARSQRVYRQLALCPGSYWSGESTSDYEYIKNQRAWVEQHLCGLLGGQLHVHKNGAFWILDQDDGFGRVFPQSTGLCDIALLLCAMLRQGVEAGQWALEADDTFWVAAGDFHALIALCKEQYGFGWGKGLRDTPLDLMCGQIIDYMGYWSLIAPAGDGIRVLPSAGKWGGRYTGNGGEDDG